MSDAYDSVIGGKLTLLGKAMPSASSQHKKSIYMYYYIFYYTKKKHSHKEKSNKIVLSKEEFEKSDLLPVEEPETTKTETELKFLERKQQLIEKRAKEIAKTSMSEKIQKFNTQLSQLPEQNDMPRLAAAGIG
ncbi:hypothetical protein WA158_007590 [Blastocystis sp. Blastoise]